MPRHHHVSLLTAAAFLLAAPLAAQAQGQTPALPEGTGKQLIEGVCTGCHQTNMITQSSGYTREGWIWDRKTLEKGPQPTQYKK